MAAEDDTMAAIASERAASHWGLHVVTRRSRMTRITARVSPSLPIPRKHPAPAATGQRLHQPRGVRRQPARRRARHALTAEGPRCVDVAAGIAPRPLRPVGVLLLHRPQGHPGPPMSAARWGVAKDLCLPAGASAPIRWPPEQADPMFEQLGIIGCGFIGGSFALALRRAGIVRRIVGYSKSPTTIRTCPANGRDRLAAIVFAARCLGLEIVLVAVPVASTEQP